jgi:hypothetical protein
MFTPNGIFPGTVLLDGFVAGMWRITQTSGTAALTIEMFRDRVSAADREAITGEGSRMLAFADPDAAHDIQFAPLA